MDAGRHRNLTLLAYSEVEHVTGYIGNFNVKIRKKARYVNEDECTACADCVESCPVSVPDEYQQGFSSRKAIYIQLPQAVPSAYLIDMDNCLGNNPIACGKCKEACEKECIDFDMQDESKGTEGRRARMWDSCMFSEYTMHTSGHNPRPARTNRLRNRVFHKFKYYPDNFGETLCVGCGRCIDSCPVNVDIADIVAGVREVTA